MGQPWTKKARCSSREVIEEGSCLLRVILNDEDIVYFCLYRIIWTVVAPRSG